MSELKIEARSLSKNFGSIVAVDKLSFEVGSGEVLGFLGPNGAGKSTTMKMLTGFLAPSAGTATINGTVSGNTSGSQGGGIVNSGTITINGTVSGNTTTGYGGGIANGGTLNLGSGNLIQNNTATTDGGGIYNGGTINTPPGPNYGSGNTPNNCAAQAPATCP